MLYVIKYSNGLYFHNKGRIILFKSIDEANDFLNLFIQFSINVFEKENNIPEAMKVPFTVTANSKITNIDFDIDKVECGTVFASELFEKRGK